MTNLIAFPGKDGEEIHPAVLLQEALEENLSGVVIVGYDADGMLHFTHSMAEPEHIVWLLRCAERETFRALDL